MDNLICIRCGSDKHSGILFLHNNGLCDACFKDNPETSKERITKQEKKLKKQTRKPKSKHKIEENIITYLQYIMNNPTVIKINRKDFETEMHIPFTSLNYMIKQLKARGYITTGGTIGSQYYIPIRWPICKVHILLYHIKGEYILLLNRIVLNENFIVPETQHTSKAN